MQIFQPLIEAIRHLLRAYTGEISLLVQYLAKSLQESPESFELVGSGSSLVIKKKSDPTYASIRLERCGICLSTPYHQKFELTPREARVLNKAVHKWLD